MTLKKIPCFCAGYEDYGLFIGVLLHDLTGDKRKIGESFFFKKRVEKEIAEFKKSHENSHRDIERYFNRFEIKYYFGRLLSEILGQLEFSEIYAAQII